MSFPGSAPTDARLGGTCGGDRRAGCGQTVIEFGVRGLLRIESGAIRHRPYPALSRGAGSRPIFTTIAIYLIVLWLLPEDQAREIFGELNGDIEMFFLSGVFLVAGATMLIVQNLDLLLAGFSKIGGIFKSSLPAIRMAIAFPSQAPMRTGMTIAMFSLIVFSLVVFATINDNFVNIFLVTTPMPAGMCGPINRQRT